MMNSWYTDDDKFLIENYNIPGGIIHYGDEQFITEQVLDVLILESSLEIKKAKIDKDKYLRLL